MVTVARNLPLETVYAVTAFVTLLGRLVELFAGIRSEVVCRPPWTDECRILVF